MSGSSLRETPNPSYRGINSDSVRLRDTKCRSGYARRFHPQGFWQWRVTSSWKSADQDSAERKTLNMKGN